MRADRGMFYPAYHLAPPDGWLNDPNGLCQMDGTFHFYFQYVPESPEGGLKHWGHYESRDLVRWNYTGIVLSPDSPYDRDGVYSGSALTEDGNIYLYYTGNVKEEGDYDYVSEGRGANTILVKTRDGHFMGEKQCLMTNEDYPADVSCHVRDPKVFKENGRYYMVQGARTNRDQGVVLVFESDDRLHWRYINRIQTGGDFGYMWECPDLFALDTVSVLSVSPQGLKAKELRFQNRYQSGYFLMKGDYKAEGGYELSEFREWDMGFDFYAPQTFLDEKGRRILVGWAGMIDCEEYNNAPAIEQGWQHMFTLPRELTLKENVICQMPVEEVRGLRRSEELIQDKKFFCTMASEIQIDNMENETMEISFCGSLILAYNREKQVFSMEFKDGSGSGRSVRRAELKDLKSLDILMDHSIMEVYINGGFSVFTTRFYMENEELEVKTDGVTGIVRKWNLEK
ncbi:glycoside hydrolase family 32 protein [Clostridium sp. Marseille-P2415]|uniref:glycoside hydrolase family 32 protein n=1 Tax=Clostridium sp. Marseille-P2415 TaxID=1805471 RepID=UPI0009888AB7|nr:glycoside hydrolase family 32 protein [Clostridium sp. Marseille-P2415]